MERGCRVLQWLTLMPGTRHFYGASAGQSTLIAAMDVFFGVKHGTAEEQARHSHYLDEMRHYTPTWHRAFLTDLAEAR